MSNSVDPKALQRAKELYFQYYPVTQIAKDTGIKRSTVQYHVMQRWKTERSMAKQDLMMALLEGKEESLTKITDFSIRALEKAVREVATRQEAPSIQEARNIVTILEKIDTIVTKDRENEEKSKEKEHEKQELTDEEVRDRLKKDPFSLAN